MKIDSVGAFEEQAAESPEADDQTEGKPLTRQEAVKSLLEEIERNDKLTGKFLKLIESRIVSQAVPVKMLKSMDESLNTYLCIRSRLKMLRDLFKYMKYTAGQL